MTWLNANWPQVIELSGDHLALSVPAILISILIAVPIGRLAHRRPKIGTPLLSAATLMYAIPALPLLIIIPVVFGIPLRSPATMIVALSVYGVALLVRTAADAFGSVDARVREAAVAVGHSPRSVFWRVDLPLAIPVLLSGIRVVTVSTVSLVTIGALIGVPSLGTLLTDGFQRGIEAEVATGVIVTIILALILDVLLLAAGRAAAPWTRTPRAKAVAA
ncbi:ABC transporter permease [Glycomyces harbinensis]|uniref:Osmoprotectant transport system permease protein n=1 Tax=Glycomyces harbinensis TaxID=58114 RepID=A0A1G7BZL2_9ACTN|nr:ABC transporter permease subunit [Glycomyces harbinensis]SDE32544.1 osmoprotectant transport system permease protein [Glycomyces harbinensis]